MLATIQELQGNVKVIARKRPYIQNDGKHDDDESNDDCVSLEGDRTVKITKTMA